MKPETKFKETLQFLLIMVSSLALGYLIGANNPKEPWDPCAEAVADVKAMQACLSVQPACHIPDGVKAFKEYHAAKDIISAQCKSVAKEN